jgi:protein gp37
VARSKIEWTNETWNPTAGCSLVSPGCKHCYAMRMAGRIVRMGGPAAEVYRPLVKFVGGTRKEGRWNGRAAFLPDRLAEPLSWRKPRLVFVDSMSDWLHEDITNEQVGAILAVAAMTPHTYQILTKRAERLPEWFAWFAREFDGYGPGHGLSECLDRAVPFGFDEDWLVSLCNVVNGVSSLPWQTEPPMVPRWPLENVWLGVSVEDQERADERIPHLLRTPAAVRFLSCEPLLGPVDLSRWLFATCHPGCGWINGSPVREVPDGCHQCGQGGPYERLDWVIVGGESGPGARITDAADIRRLVEQCRAGKVPVFVKQLGRVAIDTDWHGLAPLSLRDPKGGDLSEFPEDLRVREFPGGAK